jgi:DNA-binding CsgD family transcriptional regulator
VSERRPSPEAAWALADALGGIPIRAWRLHLDTPGVQATVPMLRGVWGAALRELSPRLYDEVFDPGPHAVPRYLLRPALADAEPAPAAEFLLFMRPDPDADAIIRTAWQTALARGLGPHGITRGELAVAELMRHGLSEKQIALRIHRSRETVKFHARNIYRKCGVAGRAEWMAWPADELET